MGVPFQGIEDGTTDQEVWQAQLALADQAEPRGFDSIWTTEHHFTDYSIAPNPTQFLTWAAARTQRVQLGSMVIVVPWHNPVRLAEELSVLDTLSGGRLIAGFGRGLGPVEFDGFGLEMGESRQRFIEHSASIVQGLTTGHIEYDGELYQQPRVAIRPTPTLSFAGRFYASAVSPQSARIMANLGFGLLIIAQKPWDVTIREIEDYRGLYEEVNHQPPPRPVLINWTSIHEDPATAQEYRNTYGLAYAQSCSTHYDFTNPRLSEVSGYEYYAALRGKIEKYGLRKFNQFLADLQIAGTPDEVLEQTIERVRLLDACAVVNVFAFGGMPAPVVQRSFELYAEKVLPVLKATDTFRTLPRGESSRTDAAPANALADGLAELVSIATTTPRARGKESE
jgi:alkanesulfonate monooxygenase SsuD/methylene tetrahydromethanopterin reductase-like flavin-dependent oxidoreductase (luciferase family)